MERRRIRMAFWLMIDCITLHRMVCMHHEIMHASMNASSTKIDPEGNPVANANDKCCWKDCQNPQKRTRLVPVFLEVVVELLCCSIVLWWWWWSWQEIIIIIIRKRRQKRARKKENSNSNVNISLRCWLCKMLSAIFLAVCHDGDWVAPRVASRRSLRNDAPWSSEKSWLCQHHNHVSFAAAAAATTTLVQQKQTAGWIVWW